MAVRASTGTYVATANSFNPAVTGTTIDAAAWNAILDEIEVEITDAVSRSGKGGMLADLDMSSKWINNLASASLTHQAVNLGIVQTLSATLETRANAVSASWAARDYVVLSAASVLANERVLTMGSGLSANDGGAGGAYTVSLGNLTASSVLGVLATGVPRGLSQTELTTLVNAVVGDSGSGGTKGAVPAPAAGDAAAGKFLKADGTWSAPPGAGSGAPETVEYLVLSNNTTLTTERRLVISAPLSATDAGANSTYTIGVNLATAADYWAATAGRVLETSATWAAAAPVQLTDAATVTCNFNAGINFFVTLAGNRTLRAENAKAGQSGTIYISQSGGARTLGYDSNFKFASGTAPALSTSLSTASGAWDVLSYAVLSATYIAASMIKNVK